MKKLLLLLTLVLQLSAQKVIKIYDKIPSGSENWQFTEKAISADGNTKVFNVVEPTLTAYIPPKHLATGTAVVIAPGGGFHYLSFVNEGTAVAEYLASKGINAFVLKYRMIECKTDDPSAEFLAKMKTPEVFQKEAAASVKLATADALQAIQYLRDHAAEWSLSKDQIGLIGFSAGGTITLSAAYNATESNRPNFVAPIYAYEPLILGDKVPSQPTPFFITVAADDHFKMLPMSMNYYKKWTDAGQSGEMHIYEKGEHGFGMKTQKLPSDTWNVRFYDWLKQHGWHKKLYLNKYEKIYGQDEVAEGGLKSNEQKLKDFANLARYKSENAQFATTKKKCKVVFFGDSITEGWIRQDSSFFAQNDFEGRGISGQTSPQLLLRFRQDVLTLNPKAVVIHIGTNDVAENTGPYNQEYTLGNIQSMTDLALAHNIKVILAAVVPSTKFEWNLGLGNRSEQIVQLNRAIKAYADSKNIPFADYHTALKNTENGMNPDIAEDGVHPSVKGFGIMKETVLKSIQSLNLSK